MNKIPHIAKLAWSALLVSTFVISGWDKERSFLGFLIVVCAWTGVRIITEALGAAIELAAPKAPPPEDGPGSGWTKDNKENW